MMKRILLYFVLPGILLGVVYSLGKSSGKREAVPVSAADFSVVQVDQTASPTPVPPIAKPVNAPRLRTSVRPQLPAERYQVRQIPRVIETQDMPNYVNTNLVNTDYANAGYVNMPVRSVYDRSARPSELGLMPLSPLQPLPESPVLAPPVQRTYRAVQPSAAKHAVDCGCGKEH